MSGRQGCGSFIGKQGGAQVISLQAGTCTYKGVIMHLAFHALGNIFSVSKSQVFIFLLKTFLFKNKSFKKSITFDSLGFGHEHNRPDRDSWIEIFWEQVEPNFQQYLNKYSEYLYKILQFLNISGNISIN